MINRPSDVTNFNGLLQSAQAALNNEKDEMDPNVMDAAKELRALLSVSPLVRGKWWLTTVQFSLVIRELYVKPLQKFQVQIILQYSNLILNVRPILIPCPDLPFVSSA